MFLPCRIRGCAFPSPLYPGINPTRLFLWHTPLLPPNTSGLLYVLQRCISQSLLDVTACRGPGRASAFGWALESQSENWI